MKKIIVFLAFLVFFKLVVTAQFNPNYNQNYFTQVDYWNQYFDSVKTARTLIGINDMRGTGLGGFTQWQHFWRKYMVPSGNFQDAFNVYQQLNNVQRYEQILGSQTSSQNTNLLLSPVNWDEIGPVTFNNILKYGFNPNSSQTEWFNPQFEGTYNLDYMGAHVGRFDKIYKDPVNNRLFTYFGAIENAGAGGLFMSTDDGISWNILGTDKIPNPDITAFEVKPSGTVPMVGTDIMFIGLASGGIYRSTDNGNTWIESCYHGSQTYPPPFGGPFPNNSVPNYFDITNTGYTSEITNFKFEFVYTNTITNQYARLFLARKDGLYFSYDYDAPQSVVGNTINNGITWVRMDDFDAMFEPFNLPYVHPTVSDHHQLSVTDIEQFTRGNQSYLVAHVARKELRPDNCTIAISDYIIYSLDDGDNWVFLGGSNALPNGRIAFTDVSCNNQLPTYSGPKPHVHPVNLEVKSDGANYVYASFRHNNSSGYTAYRFDFNSGMWENISNTSDPQALIGEANAFAINPNDDKEYFYFFNSFRRVYDNTTITQYSDAGGGNYSRRRHSDTRDMLIVDLDNIYIATDGGIYKSTDQGISWIPRSEGLGASNIGNVGVSQSPPFYVGGGFWHSGFQIYNPEEQKWHYDYKTLDSDFGEFSFLDNQIYSSAHFGPQYLYSDYDLLNQYATVGTGLYTTQIEWSENQNGLAFASFGTNVIRSTNNFVAGSNTNLTFPSVTLVNVQNIFTLPNRRNELAVLDQGNMYLFDNITTSPTLMQPPFDLDLLYQNLTGGTENARVGDVVFDSNNPDRFYVVLQTIAQWNGFSDGRIVEYDPVSGQFEDITFTTDDIIFGSSPAQFPTYISIREMEMDRQTGILYIGTSRGVYYLDRVNQIWKRYSANVPFISSDVEVLHCTGEIYASTNSRGIWKAPMLRDNVPTREWVIDQPQTWNDRVNLFCTLVIEPGVTLTVANDLVVYGNQKIIVKQGGTLILDGGKITTECGDFWAGIEVWGDRTKHQYPISGQYFQGRLIMKNNAIIENAREAVQLYNTADGYNTSGGIIQAKNSTIRNIRRGVAFLSYHNYNPSIPSQLRNNVSYFYDVTFEINKDLPDNTLPAPFVTMWDVSGVKFLGCTFQSNPSITWSPLDAGYSGFGIYTEDANFVVDDYCSSILFPCPSTSLKHTLFKDLRTGIWVNKLGVNQPFTVKNAVFEDCIIGTFSQGVSNITMKNNDFSIGDWSGVPYDYHQFGSGFLGPITSYTITDNDYIKSPSAPGLGLILGVWHYNTGSNNKTFKKNNFQEMHRALQTERINRGNALYPTGLDFQCNTITNCQYDMFIAKGLFASSPNPSYGIKENQGTNSVPEGNAFSNNGDFYEILNTTGNNINYYYYTGVANEQPITVSSDVIPTGITFTNPACTVVVGGGPRTLVDMVNDYSIRN